MSRLPEKRRRFPTGKEKKVFLKKVVDISLNCWYTNKAVSDGGGQYGGVAHLGERLHGMQEVRGSIPLISTKNSEPDWFGVFLLSFSGKGIRPISGC